MAKLQAKPLKNAAVDCVAQECTGVGYDRLRMVDLFAGAGGLSEGLSMAGFESLFASEIVPAYARTFQWNHSRALVQTADIRDLDPVEVMRELGLRKGELDLIAGGPPLPGLFNQRPRSKHPGSPKPFVQGVPSLRRDIRPAGRSHRERAGTCLV